MSFKIKKSDLNVSPDELLKWERQVREVKRMKLFYGMEFDEAEYLETILKVRENQLKRLVSGFAENSSIFSYSEMEKWKKAYNETSEDLNLHLRLYFVRTGKVFDQSFYRVV